MFALHVSSGLHLNFTVVEYVALLPVRNLSTRDQITEIKTGHSTAFNYKQNLIHHSQL